MSLPACQQRVLDQMESALHAAEPLLAAKFAIFTRLTRDEPLSGAERLPQRCRWLRMPRVHALLVIPVTLAVVVSGIVLGATTGRAQSCGRYAGLARTALSRTVLSRTACLRQPVRLTYGHGLPYGLPAGRAGR